MRTFQTSSETAPIDRDLDLIIQINSDQQTIITKISIVKNFLPLQTVARRIQRNMLHQILWRLAPVFDAPTPQPSSVPRNDAANAASAALNARCVASLLAFLDTSSSRFERLILISYLRASEADRRRNKVTRRYREDEVIAALRHLHMDCRSERSVPQ
jgi:hypothetical protein